LEKDGTKRNILETNKKKKVKYISPQDGVHYHPNEKEKEEKEQNPAS
jgi:hypothetical protein